jgi:hypothetical protein
MNGSDRSGVSLALGLHLFCLMASLGNSLNAEEELDREIPSHLYSMC